MRGTTYFILLVALFPLGCTNAAFNESVKTNAGTTFNELSTSSDSQFVRANNKDDNSANTFFVSPEPSRVGDEHFVYYYPVRVSDLGRFASIKQPSVTFTEGPSELSRVHAVEQQSRSSLIPTQWKENAMGHIPTRWNDRVFHGGQDELQPD